MWIKHQLENYDILDSNIPLVYDNATAINLPKNPILHFCAKHIEIKHHLIRDYFKSLALYISTKSYLPSHIQTIIHTTLDISEPSPSSPIQTIVQTPLDDSIVYKPMDSPDHITILKKEWLVLFLQQLEPKNISIKTRLPTTYLHLRTSTSTIIPSPKKGENCVKEKDFAVSILRLRIHRVTRHPKDTRTFITRLNVQRIFLVSKDMLNVHKVTCRPKDTPSVHRVTCCPKDISSVDCNPYHPKDILHS
ncbi:hypothetical protein CR513_14369, partial [Mucuna pruriens]